MPSAFRLASHAGFAATLIVGAACGAPSSESSSVEVRSARLVETDVLAAVCAAAIVQSHLSRPPYYVSAIPEAVDMLDCPDHDLFTAVASASAAGPFVPSALPTTDACIVIPPETVQAIFSGPFSHWDTFFRTYPDADGLFRLSGVGFDATRQRALVLVEHASGGLRGGGAYFELQLRDGTWQVVRRLCEFSI